MNKINRKRIAAILLGFGVLCAYAGENQKLAQTGFQFLDVVSDARASAMAEAMTSLQIGSSALFFNPAGMAEMQTTVDATASMNQWIADMKHNTFSLAIRPVDGRYGVIGFTAQTVDYGDFYGTQVSSNDDGYENTDIFSPTAMAFGIGYAKTLTDRFCAGFQVRYVEQDLGDSIIPVYSNNDTTSRTATNSLHPLAFDFGTQFKTGVKGLVFGMCVRNFSKEISYVDEGFELPLVFNLGISMDIMDVIQPESELQSLIVSVDASHYRSHAEQVHLGMEYRFMNQFFLRAGYLSNDDENGLTYGVGVAVHGIAFDYAYTPYGIFDNVQRMTARFAL